MKAEEKVFKRVRRHLVPRTVVGTKERPRMAVFRSLGPGYCQLIHDTEGETLSSIYHAVAGPERGTGKRTAAAYVGAKIAEKALALGTKKVALDSSRYGSPATLTAGSRRREKAD